MSGMASLIRETLQLFLMNCFLCDWAGRSHCRRRPIWLALLMVSHTDRSPSRPTGPNLKEWLREQFCDHPLEHCEDTRLHDAAYVGDLQTLRNLLQEESYRRWAGAGSRYWPVGLQETEICGLDCRLRLMLQECLLMLEERQKEELLAVGYCGQVSLGPSLALWLTFVFSGNLSYLGISFLSVFLEGNVRDVSSGLAPPSSLWLFKIQEKMFYLKQSLTV